MNREKLTLTVEEVANVFGISRGLAYEMCRKGTIPALRFGKRLVVSRRSVEKMLEERDKETHES